MVVVSLYATSKKQRKQIEELKNRILKNGHQLLKDNEFIGEAGLESLRYKAAKGRIDKVYVYSPEDLEKEFKDQVNLIREFWQFGVEVIFVNEKVKVEVTQNLISFRSSYGF